MLNVVEAFTGIGAQTAALKRAKIEHNILNTIEWEIGAMYAYDIMHNGKQNIAMYRHHSRESLIDKLSQYNLSNDGKSLLSQRSIASMSIIQMKSILYSIERNNNLIDIEKVTADDLSNDIDLFTYSFPCQDLSVSSRWWNNNKGINRESGGQSSLLWEVERLLEEFNEDNKSFPKFLLMENVNAILSPRHIDNFNEWMDSLNKFGYYNKVYTLNAVNFGIPQNRVRTYMISIYTGNDEDIENELEDFFFKNDLEKVDFSGLAKKELKNYLKLGYRNENYRKEAILSTPQNTPSRQKIFKDSVVLAFDNEPVSGEVARTITTKQDRNPNSGIVVYDRKPLIKGRDYRNLTPRETFLLMGFKEEIFDNLIENNLTISKNRTILPDSKLLKLAGNSIVVEVLKEIFLQMKEINDEIITNDLQKVSV